MVYGEPGNEGCYSGMSTLSDEKTAMGSVNQTSIQVIFLRLSSSPCKAISFTGYIGIMCNPHLLKVPSKTVHISISLRNIWCKKKD